MSNLAERALRVLEFTKVREQLAGLALTDMGAEMCRGLLPTASLAEARHGQEETEEALSILTYAGSHPLQHFEDVRHHVRLAEKGAVLPPRALLDIANCLRAASAARSALLGDRKDTPILQAMASTLSSNFPLERSIKDAIISEEEIADNASAELAGIRRQMRLCNDRIKEKLRSLTQSSSFAKYLQESIVTVRNGRYVLPVRQEYRQQVQGLVHDQSSSGATLFIEPMTVVEMGNELRQWTSKEEQEIERILSAFSAQVAMQADPISSNIDILTQLDFIFAKGALSKSMRGISPKLNKEGRIKFIRVRHPLLDPASVVPCDLWLGGEFTTLIITGPNTGGKTVTLKTVGLITLMAQAGLQVPADLGTEVAVFDRIYADIGDEQSIEQSLSTFSSHMTNIVKILDDVQENDLVLFDELGAGTDPTEGAALAQAILSSLLSRRIRSVATTHYSELKAYALTTQSVENASVEFDVSTLSPTYRLSIGSPGKSNAFEISRRLGLSDRMISAARALLSHETVKFEDVIANAEQERRRAEQERVLAARAREEAEEFRLQAENAYKKLEAGRQLAEKKAKEDARKLLERTKREAAGLLAELRLLKSEGVGGAQGSVADIQRRLRVLEADASERSSLIKKVAGTGETDVAVGDSVEVPHLNTVAVVLTLPDTRGELLVQAGIIKMKVNMDQVRKVGKPVTRKSQARAGAGSVSHAAKMECDVRGMSLDEALMEVDRYLDSAMMTGLHEVSIIHGKGTGALRIGIQRHLKGLPQVQAARMGQYGEGDAGVTIVTFK